MTMSECPASRACAGAHELGNVVKVQAGGGLVKQNSVPLRATFWRDLVAGLGRLGQKARQLEALRLAAESVGTGWPSCHVVEPHIHNGLQGAHHVRSPGETAAGLGHGQFASTSATFSVCPPRSMVISRIRAVALAVAIGAAQVHVDRNCISTCSKPEPRRWGNAHRHC